MFKLSTRYKHLSWLVSEWEEDGKMVTLTSSGYCVQDPETATVIMGITNITNGEIKCTTTISDNFPVPETWRTWTFIFQFSRHSRPKQEPCLIKLQSSLAGKSVWAGCTAYVCVTAQKCASDTHTYGIEWVSMGVGWVSWCVASCLHVEHAVLICLPQGLHGYFYLN